MFFVQEFHHSICLHPKNLNSDINKLIINELHTEIEGKCFFYGYVILILEIQNISSGQVLSDGSIHFIIKYNALILKPVKGEVIDAKISNVTKLGYFCSVGPLSIFLSNHQTPSEMLNKISPGGKVRIKIIGTKFNYNKISAVATLKDDALKIL